MAQELEICMPALKELGVPRWQVDDLPLNRERDLRVKRYPHMP